jgi:hypothetical protein
VVSAQLAFTFRVANLFLAVLALKLMCYVFNVLIQLTALFAKQAILVIFVIHVLLVIKILIVVYVYLAIILRMVSVYLV